MVAVPKPQHMVEIAHFSEFRSRTIASLSTDHCKTGVLKATTEPIRPLSAGVTPARIDLNAAKRKNHQAATPLHPGCAANRVMVRERQLRSPHLEGDRRRCALDCGPHRIRRALGPSFRRARTGSVSRTLQDEPSDAQV